MFYGHLGVFWQKCAWRGRGSTDRKVGFCVVWGYLLACAAGKDKDPKAKSLSELQFTHVESDSSLQKLGYSHLRDVLENVVDFQQEIHQTCESFPFLPARPSITTSSAFTLTLTRRERSVNDRKTWDLWSWWVGDQAAKHSSDCDREGCCTKRHSQGSWQVEAVSVLEGLSRSPRFGVGRRRSPWFVPICSDLFRFPCFLPISSDLFRFGCRTNQNKSGKHFSAYPICKSPIATSVRTLLGKKYFDNAFEPILKYVFRNMMAICRSARKHVVDSRIFCNLCFVWQGWAHRPKIYSSARMNEVSSLSSNQVLLSKTSFQDPCPNRMPTLKCSSIARTLKWFQN